MDNIDESEEKQLLIGIILNISNRISGNKIVKANIIKKKKIIVKISKYKEIPSTKIND